MRRIFSFFAFIISIQFTVSSELSRIEGVGIGLRSLHYQEILNTHPTIPWFEVLSDNYLNSQGLPRYYLDKIRQDYPVTLHGVGMSLGSVTPLDYEYLNRLKKLADEIKPVYISDHLAWISVNGHYLNDLLPLPYTEETLKHLVKRIQDVQDFLGCHLLIENPSSYLAFKGSTMLESVFISRLLEEADCHLLLDVNNLYVSAVNNGFEPREHLSSIAPNRVKQIHLAGYEEQSGYLFDTHGYAVHAPVWDLYELTLQRFGPIPTLIEWDTNIPPLSSLMAEADKATEKMTFLLEKS